MMKKTVLAMVLAATMVSGCSMIGGSETTSYADLRAEGDALYAESKPAVRDDEGKIIEEGYQVSDVAQLEAIRLLVNSAFLSAKPAYERYTDELLATPELGNYFSAVEAKDTEEEKRAVYDSLSDEMKVKVDDFNKSSVSDEIMSGLKDAALVALENSAVFLKADTTAMLSDVDFSKLMDEKDAVSLTAEQVIYLDKTVVSAYENYKIISAFSSAQ
ncbi:MULTISPECIES: hypothetical protein [Aliivibrio]|uniref:Lipoprotein n=1 Tax=Aliivibrio finisterrensis TaxID=511998 RepID=A0A6N6RWW5_9GAMM|nr:MULTISPECIES: hypothetical protein [Aliivibrio]KAB2825758.1 hypothetical protein F8B77_03440 [Aliivibrio finisterrensis]